MGLLIASLIFSSTGLARARSRHRAWAADQDFGGQQVTDPELFLGFHLASEIAPAIGMVLALVSGANASFLGSILILPAGA